MVLSLVNGSNFLESQGIENGQGKRRTKAKLRENAHYSIQVRETF